MNQRNRWIVSLWSLCIVAWTLPVWADTLGGTVVSVDPIGNKLVVKEKSKMTNRSFNLAKTAEVSLDGKSATLARAAEGQSVTVFYAGNVASRLILRSPKDEVVKPVEKTTEKPLPEKAPPKTTASTKPVRPTTTTTKASSSESTQWHQYRGPNRDNISSETGLLKEWPSDGPPQVWSVNGLGEGYSSVAISNGKLFTMGNQGDDEMVIALDLANGDKRWATRSGRSFRENMGNGPRGTPTVDGDLVYALGANGDLVCLDIETGREKWSGNILQEFGGRNIQWGISESVLIDGDKLICTPGGRGATMVALNKQTGKVIWKSAVPGNPNAAYSSAIAVDVGGVRQYVNFTSAGVVSVRASDGQPMWGQTESSNPTANCSTAVFAENCIFTASGYGTGGALFRLTSRNGQTTSQVGYSTREMKNHHGGMAVVDGYLYGCDEAILTCLDLKTGKVAWQSRSVGKGAVTVADGRLYVRGEGGALALAEINSQKYVETGRFEQPQRSSRPAWSHPVVADGKLFLRDMDRLLVYDVKAK